MGGLTGLLLASLPDTPVKKLVLNDIGPIIPKSTMQLTALAAPSADISFASLEEARAALTGEEISIEDGMLVGLKSEPVEDGVPQQGEWAPWKQSNSVAGSALSQ